MTFSRLGGFAALICAGTYVFGFVLLVTLLAPLGFGTNDIDPGTVAAFINESPGILILWNTVIYVVNALALTVLVMALARRIKPGAPGFGDVSMGIGLIWSALVLAAGMTANVGVERVAHLYPTDAAAAEALWSVMHSVELGLGGGNEIAGGVWILVASLGALRIGALPMITAGLGIATGLGGLATVIPALGEVAGAVFGLGAIAWFVAVGLSLILRAEPEAAAR